MIDNRQGGRRRGRGGQRPQGNPGRPGGGGGNRIDNRARGNAQQLHEKYKNLARDAQMAGDRVTTEYYLQFADHYFRVLNENRARFEDQRRQREESDEEFEGEDGEREEFEARDHGQRRDRDRDRGDRNNFRRDDERRERQPEQPAEAAGEAAAASEPRGDGDEGQRRARRPRRPRDDREGNEPVEAFDADRLPPSIAVDNSAADEQPAPRRRGRRPRAETANDTVEVPPAA